MESEEIKPSNNRLFRKTYMYFAVIVCVFAVLLGIVYMRMYEEATIQNFEQQLMEKAEKISKRCSQYFIDKAAVDWMDYIILLSEIDRTEIWALSNPNAIHPLGMDMAIGLEVSALSSEYVEIAKCAFHNQKEIRTKFSTYHECMVVTIGVPVQGINGEIAGAILLNAPVETQKEIVDSSWSMIFMSGMVAIIVSFAIAILFAKNLTKPIEKMRSTALQLASGNYRVKTGIVQEDEIGELASTIDFLADKLVENEVERKNIEQMRLDFFANVSHELRTPVTVIRGYTESLVDGIVTDDTRRQQYYVRMLSECKNMERLVGDLLLLSKMQNPNFVIEKEPITLQQVFKDLKRTALAIAEEKQIEIIVEQPEEPCVIMGDYGRLRQMFLVIIDNAIKFSEENSKVYITLECDKYVMVSIRDEGIGISEEELPNIFDKFYKSKLRQNAKGSGLGLAIAREICMKHDGLIKVESEVGKGTNFLFNFPKMEERNT